MLRPESGLACKVLLPKALRGICMFIGAIERNEMDRDAAIAIARDTAEMERLNFSTRITAHFVRSDDPLNGLELVGDRWLIFVGIEDSEGVEPDFYVVEVDCHTGEASIRTTM